MLDLRLYQSLGEALRAALDKWPNEICLIEADRDRENHRLTYAQFRDMALPLARALQDSGFQPGSRAAILMTNQSKWLISAYAIFFCGGILVPIDYKLTPVEQLQILARCKAEVLIVENHLWRALVQVKDAPQSEVVTALVTEAPADASLVGAKRWEEFQSPAKPVFATRRLKDPACIVYSSGTGGRPKGCVLTHENYLEQCIALTSLFPFWPGVRYLSILPTNHAIDFMVGFIGPFVCGATVVHLRTLRPEYVREAFSKYKITYVTLVPLVLKNLERGLRERFDALPEDQAPHSGLADRRQSLAHPQEAALGSEPQAAGQRPQAVWRRVARDFCGRRFYRAGARCSFFTIWGFRSATVTAAPRPGTVITLNDFHPFRADTVGKPLPGVEVSVVERGCGRHRGNQSAR